MSAKPAVQTQISPEGKPAYLGAVKAQPEQYRLDPRAMASRLVDAERAVAAAKKNLDDAHAAYVQTTVAMRTATVAERLRVRRELRANIKIALKTFERQVEIMGEISERLASVAAARNLNRVCATCGTAANVTCPCH